MTYKLPIPLPWPTIVGPLGAAEDALSRLDERLRGSPIREGWIARTHFLDACASAWVDGELVHVEDLVLHDANMDIRWPTHELTRAHSVLRARRRIFQETPQWALSATGVNALVGRVAISGPAEQGARRSEEEFNGLDGDRLKTFEMVDDDPLASQFAGLEAIGQRAKRLLSDMAAGPAESRETIIYDPDWDERERLVAWREALDDSKSLPPLLGAAIALLAWGEIEPLQHGAWLGRLLVGAMLRARSRTRSHLLCLNAGLRLIPWERRRAPDSTTKLVAVLDGFAEAARWGMKEHDRWLLARRRLDRRLVGRRSNSSLPALVELVIARPILSTGLIAKELKVTPRAAQDLVAELDLREMTGRGRYRAWGIL